LKSTLESVAGMDMRADPALAKERIMKKLHPTYLPKRIGKAGANQAGAGATPGAKRGEAGGEAKGEAKKP
jgi:hypothetical protein